jgi:hypothetical protein
MLLEEGEVHIAIFALFKEVWVRLEIVVFRVFKHEIATFFEQTLFEDEVWYCGQ